MLPVFRNNRNLPGFMDDFFGRNFLEELFNEREWSSSPSVNIFEGEEKFSIEIAAPGLEKKDFKIDLKENTLTISAEKKSEKETEEGAKVMRREFNYSSFTRSFVMPDGVDVGKIKASHSNGILTIELPKKEEYKDKLPRQIDIA